MKIGKHQVIAQIIWLAALASSVVSVNAQSISAGERKHGFCASCHGINGRSFKVHYPILAGQSAPYILHQLRDFKEHRRSDPIMDTIVPQLSEKDMRDLAAFFASLKPYSSPSKSDPIKVIGGKKTEAKAHCASCHLGPADPSISELSRIQGQHRDYIVKQLEDFRAGRRKNDNGVMQDIARSITDGDIEDLASYFASMRFDRRQRKRQ